MGVLSALMQNLKTQFVLHLLWLCLCVCVCVCCIPVWISEWSCCYRFRIAHNLRKLMGVHFHVSAHRPEEEDRVAHRPRIHGARQRQPQHLSLRGVNTLTTPALIALFRFPPSSFHRFLNCRFFSTTLCVTWTLSVLSIRSESSSFTYRTVSSLWRGVVLLTDKWTAVLWWSKAGSVIIMVDSASQQAQASLVRFFSFFLVVCVNSATVTSFPTEPTERTKKSPKGDDSEVAFSGISALFGLLVLIALTTVGEFCVWLCH